MRVDDFDDALIELARGLASANVQYVVLEDEDGVALTIVPGPSQRNLERLTRALKRQHAQIGVAGHRLDYDALVHGGPARWPLLVAGATVDVMVVDVADARWATYYHEARPIELEPGVEINVVADEPILHVRRADARDAMPELQLTQRERDRLRLQRRRALLRTERRAARRDMIRRLAGRH
jgi:hypothetical protein